MSEENRKTVEVYKMMANKYLSNAKTHDLVNQDKARRKKEKLQNFIKESLKTLPRGSKILEIGSGSGENAKFISNLGYRVIPSDIAEDFMREIRLKGLEPIKFNVLEDEFKERYNGIFCWRVFNHFTKDDALTVLRKSYDALETNGIFIFNAINRKTKEVENEWVDFPGEYNLGAERYYNYFNKIDLDSLMYQIGFKIVNYHEEGGTNNNKWLVYVLKK